VFIRNKVIPGTFWSFYVYCAGRLWSFRAGSLVRFVRPLPIFRV